MSEAYCDTDSMFEGESIGEAEPSMEHRDQDKTSEIQPKTPHKRLLKDLSRSEYVQSVLPFSSESYQLIP
jgi:hypothetical protein